MGGLRPLREEVMMRGPWQREGFECRWAVRVTCVHMWQLLPPLCRVRAASKGNPVMKSRGLAAVLHHTPFRGPSLSRSVVLAGIVFLTIDTNRILVLVLQRPVFFCIVGGKAGELEFCAFMFISTEFRI